MDIQIRKALPADLDVLMDIFEVARRFMQATGNPNQWINGYPGRELMEREVEAGHCFVCIDDRQEIIGTFCFILGEDPTYAYIEDGSWPIRNLMELFTGWLPGALVREWLRLASAGVPVRESIFGQILMPITASCSTFWRSRAS